MLVSAEGIVPFSCDQCVFTLTILTITDTLQEALHDTDDHAHNVQASTSVPDSTSILSKKVRVGGKILRTSVKHFCNPHVNAGARRWACSGCPYVPRTSLTILWQMGLISLELLKNCKANAQLIAAEAEDRR